MCHICLSAASDEDNRMQYTTSGGHLIDRSLTSCLFLVLITEFSDSMSAVLIMLPHNLNEDSAFDLEGWGE
jgi:hypothetical protein